MRRKGALEEDFGMNGMPILVSQKALENRCYAQNLPNKQKIVPAAMNLNTGKAKLYGSYVNLVKLT